MGRSVRVMLVAALLLVAGAVVNVVVAWGCARWGDHWPTAFLSGPVSINSVPAIADEYLNDPDYLRGFGHTPASVRRKEFVTDPKAMAREERKTDLEWSETRSLWCTRAVWMRWFDDESFYSRSHDRLQFGLPMRSMEYVERCSHNSAAYPEFASWRLPSWRGGWPLAPAPREQRAWFGSYGRPAHVYPITPLPLGFAVNTILYAGLIGLVLLISPAARRRRRRQRGLCVWCAYPIGVSPVCTECGAAIGR